MVKYLKIIFAISLLISPIAPLAVFSQIDKFALQNYAIDLNTNGGQPLEDLILKYNQEIDLPTPIKEGYQFLNWSSDSIVNDVFDLQKMPAESLTLYAKWVVNAYTIQFVTNGGSGINAITANYGTGLSFPTTTRTGYSFAGWHRDVDLTQVYSVPSTMPAETLTIYAKWSLNEYTITLNTNGGNSINPLQAAYGSSISIPDPVKVGHTFNGWYRDSGLSQRYLIPDTMPAENLTLYAKWAVNAYTIQFVTNGGSGINAITANYGTGLSFPITTRTGYSFAGWHRDVDLTQVYSVPSTMPAETIIIYAKWSLNEYTITLNTNGGNSINPLQAAYGSSISIPDPVKIGHTFNGWYRDSGLSQRYLIPDTMPAENLTLYAKWVVNAYTIQFVTNGGSGINAITANYGTGLSFPITTRTGYSFAGWHRDVDLTQVYSVPSTMPAETLTIYAKWSLNEYTITLNTNGGNSINPLQAAYGSSISIPDPVKVGHTFNGWYRDSGLSQRYLIPDTMPAENLTLYAKWKDYTVSFNIGYSTGSVTLSSGKSYLWGENSEGQLGSGNFIDSFQPVETLNFYSSDSILKFQHTSYATGALTTNGRLFMTGQESNKRLLIGCCSSFSSPVEITNIFAQNSTDKIIDFSMSENNGTALTLEGNLFTWGLERNGNLGNGTSYYAGYASEPINITSNFSLNTLEKISHIDRGSLDHAAALTNLGKLFLWGSNSRGQVGNGTFVNQTTPTLLNNRIQLNSDEKFIDVSLGYEHSGAITSSGRIFMWGRNGYGESIENLNNLNDINSPLDKTNSFILNANEKLVDIELGYHHSSVLTNQGRVYVWGSNWSGQLGANNYYNYRTPVDITSNFNLLEGETIVQIRLGGHSSAALSNFGRVFFWGDNSHGQLGFGNTINRIRPTELIIN